MKVNKISMIAMTACGLMAIATAGCGDGDGSGSVSIVETDGIRLVCGGGVIRHGPTSIQLNGVTIETLEDIEMLEAELVMFDDENNNGEPDDGETVYRSFRTTNPGRSWVCGTINVTWGQRQRPPVMKIRVITASSETDVSIDVPTGKRLSGPLQLINGFFGPNVDIDPNDR